MRDPLVTPAVGDVIEGRDGDSVYRWTVESVDEKFVSGLVRETDHTGSMEDTFTVDLDNWPRWGDYTDVRVVATAAGPVPPSRDPLVDPDPGDVVRATDAETGYRVVYVVTHADGGIVRYSWTSPTHGASCVLESDIERWRDWSTWTDVAVLS